MKTGVGISPWAVRNTPALADVDPSLLSMLNIILRLVVTKVSFLGLIMNRRLSNWENGALIVEKILATIIQFFIILLRTM